MALDSEVVQDLHTLEIVPPSYHEDLGQKILGLFSTVPAPISLEFLILPQRLVPLLQGPEAVINLMASRLSAIWPSSTLIPHEDDQIHVGTRDSFVECVAEFVLGEPPYLPLHLVDGGSFHDARPQLLPLLSALDTGEALRLQVILLKRSSPDWLPKIQRRLKTETQRGYTLAGDSRSATGGRALVRAPEPADLKLKQGFLFLSIILGALGLSLLILDRYVMAAVLGFPPVLVGGGLVWRLLSERDDDWQRADLSLVRQKVIEQEIFYEAAIRAQAWASSLERARELFQMLEDAMGRNSIAGGNRLILKEDIDRRLTCSANPFEVDDRDCMWLGNRELAALWQLPIVRDGVSPSRMTVRSVEARTPDSREVEGFYLIGESLLPDGRAEPIHINRDALRRNILLVGKPGAGKTNLMTHLALAGMQDSDQPAIVVVDPHGDMADRLLGVIDPELKHRLMVMDIGDEEFSLTYNPLNAKRPGWDVESVTNSIVDIGQALWTDYWGPRMQNVLKRGVQLLVAANKGRSRDDQLGLSLLANLLDINHETRKRFLEAELEGSEYRDSLARWFYQYYRGLTRYTRETIIQSVLYKAHRFEELPLLPLFSCPKSTLDLSQILKQRKVLVINTRMSRYGPEMSSFVGSLMINVLLRQLARQGERQQESRVPVMMVIDEFQTYLGVPWQELLAQMRKYGGRVVIGTQSFASLRQQDEHLPGVIMSGTHSLFAFLMNGEDADYLTRYELGREKGGPGPETLTNLEPYRAYVRMVRKGGTLTHPFYFQVAAPPEYDKKLADEIWDARSEYSLPYPAALREARGMLNYLDRYALTPMSTGGGGSKSTAPHTENRTSEIRAALLGAAPAPELLTGVTSEAIGDATASAGGRNPPMESQDRRGNQPTELDLLLDPVPDELFDELEQLLTDTPDPGEDESGTDGEEY